MYTNFMFQQKQIRKTNQDKQIHMFKKQIRKHKFIKTNS